MDFSSCLFRSKFYIIQRGFSHIRVVRIAAIISSPCLKMENYDSLIIQEVYEQCMKCYSNIQLPFRRLFRPASGKVLPEGEGSDHFEAASEKMHSLKGSCTWQYGLEWFSYTSGRRQIFVRPVSGDGHVPFGVLQGKGRVVWVESCVCKMIYLYLKTLKKVQTTL